jgi:iron complex transport system substrate-binding protein
MHLDEVLTSIDVVGRATGNQDGADRVIADLRGRLDAVAVLEWTDPPFSAGHWVPDMVTAAGGQSVLGTAGARSSTLSWDQVVGAGADVVVVAPCGFRLDGARALARQLVDDGRLPAGVPVWAVDADAAFVRPGPRLVDGVETLAAILHPGTVPLDDSLAVPV